MGFEVISYDYNQLCNCFGHLIIDILVAKDRIPFNASSYKWWRDGNNFENLSSMHKNFEVPFHITNLET
jgi:hypothetical protein